MKKLLLTLVTVASFGFHLIAYSHEGHDEAPGKVKATKGGEVLIPYGKNLNVEVVKQEGNLKVYPLPHKGDSLPLDGIKVVAITKPSKKSKKSETIEFKKTGDYFEAPIDLKGASHLTLEIAVTLPDGKTDKFKTTVD